MEHQIKSNNGGHEILLSGRFTFQDHDTFSDILELIRTPGTTRFVVDLSNLDFADSAALGLLIVARDTAKSNDVNLVLRGARGKVKDVFDAAGFARMFTLE